MNEILRLIPVNTFGEDFDNAYRAAVIDNYSQIGDAQNAVKWMWADLAANQGGN